ncbi:succinate dehydrogenase, cytochrome b556 subunit [Pseudoalteromonas sp. NBT06-2]|uniref:succinate dehydrogenase, cytochrome b556 subunit n=1 Tax=Pseudoalteromonas sp. NBT06-2 TaxID=2025950 RepID=UPI000BA5AF8A|nr:succinate dehydrogenase, cytochrome b556 subunit [Pseudoalteromonas sp. NBT06-2]PAJ76310.1 succinate dehydrogenase, cytochrome b556 subunit [Pseudoalteromonas sp. NBT06-2]
MTDNRPKNLDLSTMALPIMGVASILHRISAVVIWVGMAFLLPALYFSLKSPEGFNEIKTLLTENFFGQFFIWGFLTALGYYIMGSLKHIIQEFGYFETLSGGRAISQVAIGAGVLLSLLTGFWIWG